ncbi:MAG: sigma-54 dependent transcriptional regulator [marine benthic group bacterium]|nr:sigma-54 dependent transcriptional regulator [Gemmatimonadota bacterium]
MSGARTPRLLLVDDDRAFRISTAELLRQDGYDVATAAEATEASQRMAEGPVDLVLLDVRMPRIGGLGILEALRLRGERVPVLMISGFGTIETAVEALKLGADDFLTKPVDPELLSRKVAELLESRPAAWPEFSSLGMVGRSPAMRDVYEAVQRVAPSDATVLVTGETGTGKELVARAVHDLSERAAGPFLAVNCAGLAEGVLESELFGHVRGSFTGATTDREGLFRAAEGGTILLDEIGDMSERLQQRLLRVLQEREVTPVGSNRPIPVDVRVVAATRRDLRQEAAAGRFRDDLFYRLNVFPIQLPPLRERHGDVPLLVEAALDRLRSRSRVAVPDGCTPAALRLLRAWRWPGNVRELLGVVESAAIRSEGQSIGVEHLPSEIRETAPGRDALADDPRYAAPADGDAERAAIAAALDAADGHREKAARMLGMSRTTLWRKMKDYGLAD